MNSRKIKIIILISILVSTAIILFPLLFICNIKDAITLGATLLSGLAAVGAIAVGLTVYEDIIGKKILEKQFDTVSLFLEEIKSLLIKVACYSNNNLILFSITPFEKDSTFISSLKSNPSIDIEKTKVIFSVDNYYEAMEKLFKLKNNIHMPVELKAALDFIGPSVMCQVTDKGSQLIAKVIINDKFDISEIDNKIWVEFSEQPLSLGSYFEAIENIIKSLETWIQQNSKAKIKLNI